MKDALLQTRYPYTAAVITIMWLGTAIVVVARPDIALELVITGLALATLIVAVVGFSASR